MNILPVSHVYQFTALFAASFSFAHSFFLFYRWLPFFLNPLLFFPLHSKPSEWECYLFISRSLADWLLTQLTLCFWGNGLCAACLARTTWMCVVLAASVDHCTFWQAIIGSAVFAAEVVKVVLKVSIQGGNGRAEKGSIISAGKLADKLLTPLLISSHWPVFEALCSSPPLSIVLHSWDGRHGDHS